MNNAFNSYDYIGVIIPGAVVISVCALGLPDIRFIVLNGEVTVGGLGMFLIFSFIVGHLLQAFGNAFERLFWWCFGGMPTEWILNPKQKLVTADQRERLLRLVFRTDLAIVEGGEQCSSAEWRSYTREIYARVKKAEMAGRMEIFNRNYGLMRGMAVAFGIGILLEMVVFNAGWAATASAGGGFMLSTYRMYRFALHYARELTYSALAL